MTTIGVVGANGQVGTEVCLTLSQMEGVRIIPICRTEYASAFLRRCGLECWHGEISNAAEAVELLRDCELIADFSLPKGLPSDMRKATQKIVTNVARHAPGHARFVYISSTMALGMGSKTEGTIMRRHLLAHTVYGATKRYGERLAFRLGKQFHREIYVLRLGNVHGELQAVSRHMMSNVRTEVAHVPDAPSNSVFAFTIAEALLHIALGQERPGCYTLVSEPQWSWKELHEFYCRKAGVEPRVLLFGWKKGSSLAQGRKLLTRFAEIMINPLVALAMRHREPVEGYCLYTFPAIERRLRAWHACRTAHAQIERARNRHLYRPYLPMLGCAPGRRLRTLTDSRTSMEPVSLKVQRLLAGIVAER